MDFNKTVITKETNAHDKDPEKSYTKELINEDHHLTSMTIISGNGKNNTLLSTQINIREDYLSNHVLNDP